MEVKISKKITTLVNERIQAKTVRVIAPDGEQLGVLLLRDAISKAQSFNLDLVEVSPNANPPVCKIMDFGRYKYEQTKKTQEAKKKQNTNFQVKEVKLRPNTDENDLNTKINHIKKFLQKKQKVKITLMFRGREIVLVEKGKQLLAKIIEATNIEGIIEQEPKFEGKTLIMALSPK